MKKKLLAAAILASLTLSASAALAATPTFSGDAQLLTQKGTDGDTFTDVRMRLNIDGQLGDGMYAHGRIMGIDMTDFSKAGTGLSGASAQMEQMYLGGKLGAVDVKVGRQPLGLGSQGLMSDVNGIEGLSLATAAGDVNMFGFVGRSDETYNASSLLIANPRDTVAFNVGTKIDAVKLGASYMKTSDARFGENEYYGFSAGGKVTNNVALDGEYIKNDSRDADGYLVKATIGDVAKKGDINYAVSYRDIDAGAVDGDWVTNSAYVASKAVRVATNYKVTDNATLSVYKDFSSRADAGKEDHFRAELNVNF